MNTYHKEQLCQKIQEIFPEIGECGVDIKVTRDSKEKVWLIDLKKGRHELLHYLEYKEADDCLEGKQCVSLGLEIAQLRNNMLGEQF